MAEEDGVNGDEPLVDGMSLSLRLRRDFTVTEAGRLLAVARRIHQDLNPGVSAEEARTMVSCAADALYVILEDAGLIGDGVDGRLAGRAADGLAVGGWRAEVVANEPWPLTPQPRSDCLRGDVFALPARSSDSPEGAPGPAPA